jgi:tetratricopeptide (TPR) repeat protein
LSAASFLADVLIMVDLGFEVKSGLKVHADEMPLSARDVSFIFANEKLMRITANLLVLLGSIAVASACIWDATTLEEERTRRPDLAEVILNTNRPPAKTASILKRIAALNASQRTNEVNWWNDLAGAHLRLGRAEEAVKLLEPVVARFADDYGMNANLGTAHHLAGNYVEAEKYIRRGLEINPKAHFGLERYHLALLQYLVRDGEFKRRHVFVDEWTIPFLLEAPEYFSRIGPDKTPILTNRPVAVAASTNAESQLAPRSDDRRRSKIEKELADGAERDDSPEYRSRWNLASDTNFLQGVTYMAELNPKEPAVFVMAGIAAFVNRDFNLGVAAFERAIALNSPQADLLRWKIADAREFISKARHPPTLRGTLTALIVLGVCVVGGVTALFFVVRWIWRRMRSARSTS